MPDAAIGLDVGGTKIAGVLIDGQGHIHAACMRKTEASRGRERVLHHILTAIYYLASQAQPNNLRVVGVGVGLPGQVPPTGSLGVVPNIPSLSGYDLRRRLKGLPNVHLANDADCFTLAEHAFGVGGANMAGVVWGTGVGAGLILDGELRSGPRGLAGELGHTLLDPSSSFRSGTGQRGDLESLCGGAFIPKRYAGRLHAPTTQRIWRSKEPAARRLREEVLDAMAAGLVSLVTLTDVECVVLGGGMLRLPVVGALKARFRRMAHPGLHSTRIVKSSIGELAGALGAARLVF